MWPSEFSTYRTIENHALKMLFLYFYKIKSLLGPKAEQILMCLWYKWLQKGFRFEQECFFTVCQILNLIVIYKFISLHRITKQQIETNFSNLWLTEKFLQFFIAYSDNGGSNQSWFTESNFFSQSYQIFPPQCPTDTLT